jgi:hypothetical protein
MAVEKAKATPMISKVSQAVVLLGSKAEDPTKRTNPITINAERMSNPLANQEVFGFKQAV